MNDASLRTHLVNLLTGKGAHIEVKQALRDLPPSLRHRTAPGSINTPWRLLEHMRIAQWDILEFSRDSKHVSPDFPSGYWPPQGSPGDDASWESSRARFENDLDSIQELVLDPGTDLFAAIPHGTGQTILREALLVADHNAYHLGQLMLVQKVLGGGPHREVTDLEA